jgi:hypothetical protein
MRQPHCPQQVLDSPAVDHLAQVRCHNHDDISRSRLERIFRFQKPTSGFSFARFHDRVAECDPPRTVVSECCRHTHA